MTPGRASYVDRIKVLPRRSTGVTGGIFHGALPCCYWSMNIRVTGSGENAATVVHGVRGETPDTILHTNQYQLLLILVN